MKQRSLFILCLILFFSFSASAQIRRVTNTDLEKYKEARLKAEREYRENYEKLGMPSPEELARRRDQSALESQQLSEKLRAERIDREKLSIQRMAALEIAAASSRPPSVVVVPMGGQPGYGGYLWSYGSGYRRYHRVPYINYGYPSGYFAGGAFWPTPGTRYPPVRPPRPIWHR